MLDVCNLAELLENYKHTDDDVLCSLRRFTQGQLTDYCASFVSSACLPSTFSKLSFELYVFHGRWWENYGIEVANDASQIIDNYLIILIYSKIVIGEEVAKFFLSKDLELLELF